MTHRIALAFVAALAAPSSAQDVRKGPITVSQSWSRVTSARAAVGAGFLTIRNRGQKADRLVSATSPRAGKAEIHTMSMDGGIMRMRPLVNGIEVPAGGEATLSPGASHIMLIGLKSPLKLGERIPATLRFARAGTVEVQFVVGRAGDAASSIRVGGKH